MALVVFVFVASLIAVEVSVAFADATTAFIDAVAAVVTEIGSATL